MKTTVRQQRLNLSHIKSEIEKGNGIKSIVAFIIGLGNPDNINVNGNTISIRISHKYTHLTVKDGY